MNTNLSMHAMTARLDRITFIATMIGIGEVRAERSTISRSGGHCVMQLTSTGVIVVKGKDDGTIVTMYLATVSVAKTFFPNSSIPKDLFRIIDKNQRNGLCNIYRDGSK